MEELIKIRITPKGTQVVNARTLHEFLNVGKDFSTWIKYALLFQGFEEMVDYVKIKYDVFGNNIPLPKKGETDNQSVAVHRIEYTLTIDCAKHICMVQKNEKGKQARDYFIKCEKELKQLKYENVPPDYPAALRAWADEIEKKQSLEQENKILKPLALMAEQVLMVDKELSLREVAGVINIKGFGRNKLFKLLREKMLLSNNNIPYRIYIERGYFRLVEILVKDKIFTVTHATQKGLEYIVRLVNNEKQETPE
jgi:anti-repressor protein